MNNLDYFCYLFIHYCIDDIKLKCVHVCFYVCMMCACVYILLAIYLNDDTTQYHIEYMIYVTEAHSMPHRDNLINFYVFNDLFHLLIIRAHMGSVVTKRLFTSRVYL